VLTEMINRVNSDLENQGTTVLRRSPQKSPPKSWQYWLIGRPLPTADAPHQTIGKLVGLAVFAGDALSSVAYAPQETLVILAAAGTAGFQYAFPIAVVVTILLAIVTLSYQQTIHAYPNGGGAYIVARDNLGKIPALASGAALLTDYVLLAAVAVASGSAQIVSAYPALIPYRVIIALGLITLIMLANMRGVKEAGATFAIPVYFFLATTFLTIGVGFIRFFTGTLGMVPDPPILEMISAAQPVTLFLILRAFSSGTTALTGVECISDGVTAFKEPRSKNAGLTMIWMSSILGILFLGITFLLHRIGAVPSETETVISQLARTIYGNRGLLYLGTISGTTIILVLATNTAFADFPRLSAILAGDGYLPRQMTFRGSRLVYSRGIAALGIIASSLVILFHASVTALVPLWAIGVFLSFTISQFGMARRWLKIGHLGPQEKIQQRGSVLSFNPGWLSKMLINGLGALVTAIVTVVFAFTKFQSGAWIVIILIPMLVMIFSAIHRHYVRLADDLALKHDKPRSHIKRHRVLLPFSGVHEGTLAALSYARILSSDITAVYVSLDPAEAEIIRQKWEVWGEGTRLVILDSPYRLLLEPLVSYIEEIVARRQPNEMITIVVPHFIPRHWWNNLLHTQTAAMLRFALLFRPGIVITDVPYQVE
jgi:amino acid transporter